MKIRLLLTWLSMILLLPQFTFADEDLTQATISCVQDSRTPLEKLQQEIREEMHGQEEIDLNMLPYPIIKYHNRLSHISGGISSDEVRFMRCMQSHFPLTVVFAERIDGHTKEIYIADVHIKLTDADKQVVLDTLSEGPFLLINAAAGQYTITADYYGATKESKVTISPKKRKRAVFLWDNRTATTIEESKQ